MKKYGLYFVLLVLVMALITGCGETQNAEPPATETVAEATEAPAAGTVTEATEAPASEAATEATETVGEEEEDIVYEGDASSYYIDVVYAEQISRYHTALVEQWSAEAYLDNGLSALPSYYYEGNPLENVGFGFVDLDNDGHWELIIGAILSAETDPAVFEIWTMVDGEPVMLAQGGSRNRYVLQYNQEDEMWYVANECANGAANHATYYLMLNEGKFEVVQGVIFDALADEQNPWFLTYDLDWDVSNDTPTDESTANAVLESNRKHNTALEYFPYIFY